MVKLFLVIMLVFSICFSLIFNIIGINAIGVSSPYSGDLALELFPGEEKDVYLRLSNFDIEEGIIMQGEILEGNEIASLDESIFEVPYESIEVYAKMSVKIPEEAKAGEKYNIKYKFKQIGGEGGGMVSFSQGILRNFDVVVKGGEKPEIEEELEIVKEPEIVEGELVEEKVEGKLIIFWIFVGIVCIIILLVFVLFIKNRKEKQMIS